MSDELHEINRKIGQLEAENAEAQRQRDAMFRKLDEILKDITKLTGAIEMLARDHNDTAKKVRDEIMPVVDEISRLKQRGLGVLAFIGFCGTGIGAGVLTLVQKWNGGG